jgi:hypothetical protein
MNKLNLLAAGGAAALGLALIALPASSSRPQKPDDSTIARLQQKIEKLQAELQARQEVQEEGAAELADAEALEESARVLALQDQDLQKVETLPGIVSQDFNFVLGDDGSSWLGVETHEVTAEKAKELKLSAERGVVLG